jgi:hypothetical protein
MAYTSVVTSSFFEKMIGFLRELEKEHGPIALAMVTPLSISNSESWNLYISAAWLDKIGLRQATKDITARSRQYLGPLAKQYNGTWVVRTNEMLVQTLTTMLDIPKAGTAYKVDGLELSLFDIDEAVVFIANSSARATTNDHKISA